MSGAMKITHHGLNLGFLLLCVLALPILQLGWRPPMAAISAAPVIEGSARQQNRDRQKANSKGLRARCNAALERQ